MNFPLENPIYHAIYWLLNTPGIGGITFALLITVIMGAFGRTLVWIVQGAQANEAEIYTYPTPALTHDEE